MSGPIKPTGGQSNIQPPEVEHEAQHVQNSQPEPKAEGTPVTPEQQEKMKQSLQSESQLAGTAMKAKMDAGLQPGPEKTKGKAAPAPAPAAPVADAERLKKMEGILEKSPTGKAMAEKAKKAGTEFYTGPAGKGSVTSGKKIIIDKNESPEKAALTYVHEAHHATNPKPDAKKVKKEEYVKAMVQEESDGTVLSIETKNELKAAGVDTKGAKFPLEDEYNSAKKKAMDAARKKDPKISDADAEKIGREAGSKRVEEGFRKGEVITSNTKEKYTDYYGKDWEKQNKK
jgi:type VI secretion system secreted protein VgrG